jgi:hypothetical protein
MDRLRPVTLQTCGRRRICSEFADDPNSVLTANPPPQGGMLAYPTDVPDTKVKLCLLAATDVAGADVLTDTIQCVQAAGVFGER